MTSSFQTQIRRVLTDLTSLSFRLNWFPQISKWVRCGRAPGAHKQSTEGRRGFSLSEAEETSSTRSSFSSSTVARTRSRTCLLSRLSLCIMRPVRVSRRSNRAVILLMFVREMLRYRRRGSSLTAFWRHSVVNLVRLTLRAWRFLRRPREIITGSLFSSIVVFVTLSDTRLSAEASLKQLMRLLRLVCFRLVAVKL